MVRGEGAFIGGASHGGGRWQIELSPAVFPATGKTRRTGQALYLTGPLLREL
jgi:hypothetical protein